ncbi:hypothetical protein D3C81_2081190 [compost metagenome]
MFTEQLDQRLGIRRIAEPVMGIDIAPHLQQPGGQPGQHVVGDGGDGNELAENGGSADDQGRLPRKTEEAPTAQRATQG